MLKTKNNNYPDSTNAVFGDKSSTTLGTMRATRLPLLSRLFSSLEVIALFGKKVNIVELVYVLCNLTVNLVPNSLTLSTLMVPLWASMICLAIVKPRPTPLFLPALDLST
jgi:hypothetical protein